MPILLVLQIIVSVLNEKPIALLINTIKMNNPSVFLLSSAIIIYQFPVSTSLLLSKSVFSVFELDSCFRQASLVVLTYAYKWHDLLMSPSQTLPQMKCPAPLTQLITALTSFPILFTSNYSRFQLWEYWGGAKYACVDGAFHFLNMHSIKVCILLSKCSWAAFKYSLWCPQPVFCFLRVWNRSSICIIPFTTPLSV